MRAYGVDLHPVYQAGFQKTDEDFGIFKVSEGREKYPGYKEFAMGFNFRVTGAYHYFRAGIPPRDQYVPFLEAQEEIGADFLALDFEDTEETFEAGDIEHLKTLHDKVIELSGKRVLLYSNPSDIQKYLFKNGYDWIRRKPAQYPLWVAQWPYAKNEWVGNYTDVITKPEVWMPRLPAGMTSWMFWQFYVTDRCHDVYNGTIEDLEAWIQFEGPIPPSDCVPAQKSILDQVLEYIEELKSGL